MQAANDNLAGLVQGFDEWIPLHEAARKAVADCAQKRAASHQFVRRKDAGRNDGAHEATLRGGTISGTPLRLAWARQP